MLHSLDVDVSVLDERPLTIKFSIELGILAFSIIVDCSLFINFCSQRLDKANIGVYSSLVIFIHPSLFFVEATKVLLEVQQLVLKDLVVALALPEIICFLHELGDYPLLLCGSS